MAIRYQRAREKGSTRRRRSVCSYCLAAAVCGLVALTCPTKADSLSDDGALTKLILAQHQEAYSIVRSLQYESTEDVERQPITGYPITHTSVSRSVSCKDGLRAATSHVRLIFATGEEMHYVSRTVLGDRYFAYSLDRAGPNLYMRDSPDGMAKNAADSLRTYGGPDPLKYGIGDGQFTLASFREHAAPQARWKVSPERESDGASCYMVRAFNPAVMKSDMVPYMEWYVAPDRGLLATRIVKRVADGRVGVDVHVDVERQPGWPVWLPTTVRDELMPAWFGQEGSGPARERRVYHFREIKVNPDLPNSTFSLAYLGCRDGTLVSKVAADGTAETLAMVDNEVLPLDVAGHILTAKRTFSNVHQSPVAATAITIAPPASPGLGEAPRPQRRQCAWVGTKLWLVVAGAILIGAAGLLVAARRRRDRKPIVPD